MCYVSYTAPNKLYFCYVYLCSFNRSNFATFSNYPVFTDKMGLHRRSHDINNSWAAAACPGKTISSLFGR